MQCQAKLSDRPSVVIIGAGFAGVGAARRLIQGGLGDVTLLEAAERPGGRVQTVNLDRGFVELGAQFLHGESELFHFAQRQGLLRVDEDEDEEPVPDTVLIYQYHTFRMPDSTALDHKDVVHNLKIFEELVEQQANAQEGINDFSVSVAQFLHGLYPQCTARMAGNAKVKAAMIKWFESWTVMDCAATTRDISLPGTARYEYHQGNGVSETSTGMWGILQGLLQEVSPRCRLLLGKPAKRVLWDNSTAGKKENDEKETPEGADETQRCASVATKDVTVSDQNLQTLNGASPLEEPKSEASPEGRLRGQETKSLESNNAKDGRVRIECEDGEVLHADHVIVTPSLGVLKEHQDFFVPQLPSAQREAIDTLGFGNVAKVFLLWEEQEEEEEAKEDLAEGSGCCRKPEDSLDKWRRRMFGSDVEGMALVWPEDVQVEISSSRTSQRTSGGEQWYESVSLMESISSYGPCLVAWLGGEGAIIMESLPVSEVKDVLFEILTRFTGNSDLPPPSHLIRSEWHQNPFIRGSYSYLPTGVPLERQDMLSHPLPSPQDPVMQLAGEACSIKYYSTAHGALESGQHAANTLLQHYSLMH